MKGEFPYPPLFCSIPWIMVPLHLRHTFSSAILFTRYEYVLLKLFNVVKKTVNLNVKKVMNVYDFE